MAYVTAAEFTDYLRNEIGATDSVHVAADLASAELAVNDHCDRIFAVAGASSARVFYPADDLLFISDCTGITSVVDQGGTVAASSYLAEPLNGRSKSGEVRPYDTLRRLGTCWAVSAYAPTVTVTAAWGWAATPTAIVSATKILGKGIVEMRNARGGVIAADMFGPVRVPRKIVDTVSDLLEPYRLGRSVGV